MAAVATPLALVILGASIDFNSIGKITDGIAQAELKYLSRIVALIPGLAAFCSPSKIENNLPKTYGS